MMSCTRLRTQTASDAGKKQVVSLVNNREKLLAKLHA
jgi:hypothetical protein